MRKRMPLGWRGTDRFARYRACGIDLGPAAVGTRASSANVGWSGGHPIAWSSCLYSRTQYGGIMRAEKTVSVSFRVSERFKSLLDAAAERENRSRTNLLETLLFRYCEENGLESASSDAPATGKGAV
jgi:hypothetical protein